MIRAALLCALALAATSAEARRHHHRYHYRHSHVRAAPPAPVPARAAKADRCVVVQAAPVAFSSLPWWRSSLMSGPQRFEWLK